MLEKRRFFCSRNHAVMVPLLHHRLHDFLNQLHLTFDFLRREWSRFIRFCRSYLLRLTHTAFPLVLPDERAFASFSLHYTTTTVNVNLSFGQIIAAVPAGVDR